MSTYWLVDHEKNDEKDVLNDLDQPVFDAD
jgi:hypothetical protein